MRILVVTQQNSGVGYHRLMMPIYYMPKEYAYFTDTINDEILSEKFDIVVVNRFIASCHISNLITYRKKYGFKLIIDIDDYWHLDPWHILYGQYEAQPIIDHIKAADLVTCTNMGLRYYISKLNENVHVLPNALPFGKDQFTDVKHKSDKTRVLYAGSITHEKDIAILRNPFKKILGDKHLVDQLKFIMCGYDPANEFSASVWGRMINDYTVGLKMPGYIKPALPIDKYMNFYCEADIAVVPLVSSRFNSMKSNLKVLEAACKKIPVIVSGVDPYGGCPYTLKVNNQTDWYKNIKKLATDAIYSKELGQANFEWCNEYFHLDKINILREQLYRSII
jgi:glycosyltransferase involved in cell wall biosynthesis